MTRRSQSRPPLRLSHCSDARWAKSCRRVGSRNGLTLANPHRVDDRPGVRSGNRRQLPHPGRMAGSQRTESQHPRSTRPSTPIDCTAPCCRRCCWHSTCSAHSGTRRPSPPRRSLGWSRNEHVPDGSIVGVEFEWSPGRRNPTLTNDKTAADVAVLLQRPSGHRHLSRIETKCHEAPANRDPGGLSGAASADRALAGAQHPKRTLR